MALFSARIKALESQLEGLTAERDQLAANNLEIAAANVEFNDRHTAHEGIILNLTGERDTAVNALAGMTVERDSALAAHQAELASRETAVATEVTRRLSAAGGDPILRDPKATDPTPGATGSPTERLAASFKIA